MVKSRKKENEEPTCFNIYKKLIRYSEFLGEIAGANILPAEYKYNIRTFLVVFFSSLFIFAYIYMFFNGVPLNEMIKILPIIILGIQGMIKLYTILSHRDKIRPLLNQLHRLHETNVGNRRNHKPLLLCVRRCLICYKLFTISYFGVIIIYDLLPCFIYYYYGERVLIIPVYIPSSNADTTYGYTMNMIFEVMVLTYGATGLLVADMLFLILVLHSTALVSHFKYAFDDLNGFLDDPLNTTYDLGKTRDLLREAWIQHLGIIKYINDLNEIYSTNILFHLVTCAAALTVSLFLIVWDKTIVAPFIVIAILFQLLEYCILGTIIQIQNEKIITIIYSSLWYKLKTIEQKCILIMLMRAQNPPELNAGKFAKLNVETCMQVLKATYSYLMMILEYFN